MTFSTYLAFVRFSWSPRPRTGPGTHSGETAIGACSRCECVLSLDTAVTRFCASSLWILRGFHYEDDHTGAARL